MRLSRPAARSSVAVGGGILLSRITGVARDAAIAGFFGTTLAADAFYAALRIPNVLRNLLGEGTLSAAFVPVYSRTLAAAADGQPADGSASAGGPADSRRLARGVLGLVLASAGLLAGLGILVAPWLTRAIAFGFGPEATALTTTLVRILFPMSGILILGGWCLGILNSHGRFFLPYVAPVLWNVAQVAGLFLGAALGWEPLVVVLAWSTLAGAILQVGVQLPVARRLAGSLRPALEVAWEPIHRVARNTLPVISSQGVFQLSSWMDLFLASLLPIGAVAAIGYAQRIVYLPLSLFGVSVAAASLPEMSRETRAPLLRGRLANGFFQILFFVLPSAVALILLGDLAVSVLYERGEFGASDRIVVTGVLIAYSLGLVASSSVKLFASGFHALQDTRTPLRYAAVSVLTGLAAGAALMFALEDAGYGVLSAAGLALGSAVGSWLNLGLLWMGLSGRVGRLFGPGSVAATVRLTIAAGAAAAAALLVRAWLEPRLGGGTLPALGVLAGTLSAGGVAYLLIARRPPVVAPSFEAPDAPDGSDAPEAQRAD